MTFHGIDNMKKITNIIGLALLSGALLTGCETMNGHSEANNPEQATTEFLVFMDPYTRASLQDDYSAQWNVGDRISVSDGTQWYTFEATESGFPARFKGEAPAADKYFAVYPAASEAVCDEDGVVVEIPAVQSVASAVPSPETDCWVGESRGSILHMRNVCGHIVMSIVADDIKAITFEGTNSEVLAGKLKTQINSDGLTVIPTEESGRSVMIIPASGETFASGSYCVSLAPATFRHGMLLTFDRLGGGRSYRTLTDSISVASASVVNIGNWDLSAPEIGTVTTGEVALTRAKAVLNGSMTVTNFVADKMTCGFEYKTVSATEWTRVTCPQASLEFSYELVLNSAEPHVFRAWAEVNGTDRLVYGEVSEEFAPETLVLHILCSGDEGKKLLIDTWGWKTNGNNSSTKRGKDMNNLTYYYTYNGVDYPFTFWSLQEGINASGATVTTGGYCMRASSNPTTYLQLALNNLAKEVSTDGHPAWMQLPCPANAKLVEIDFDLYNNFKGVISTEVNADGTYKQGTEVASYTGNDSFPIALNNSVAGLRYYFTTQHLNIPRINEFTLTYLYTE